MDELAESRFCGFALAFDRLAKSPAFSFNAYSSNCISEVSCSLLFKFVTNLFKPWEILVHEWELSLFTDLILISTPYLPCRQKVVTSNTGPIWVFSLIQPFGSEVSSSLGKVYSRLATESVNCKNSSVCFVMKYCPTSTVFRNPVSVQNLLNLSCGGNFSIRSPYLCNRNYQCAGPSFFKSTFVLITLGTNEELDCPHNGSHRSIVNWFVFFKNFCDCAVKTELIYRSNCAKNSFNRFLVGTIVYRQFSTTFAFEHSSGQWTRGSKDWVSAFSEFDHHQFSESIPFSSWSFFVSGIPLCLCPRSEEWRTSCWKSFCK